MTITRLPPKSVAGEEVTRCSDLVSHRGIIPQPTRKNAPSHTIAMGSATRFTPDANNSTTATNTTAKRLATEPNVFRGRRALTLVTVDFTVCRMRQKPSE